MNHELLGILWYVLLAVLWTGFVVLESLSSGVGMHFRSARNEPEGRALQYTVGPYWDGSQVWIITAGGATFAAFPAAFATMFSNLYIALFLLLVMLIVRGIAMELVYKDDHPLWQKSMGVAWVVSSYGVALLLGVRFVNLFLSASTAEAPNPSFLALLSKVGILGGLLFIEFYHTSGVLWANIKARGECVTRLLKRAIPSAVAAALIVPIVMLAFNSTTQLFAANFEACPALWVLPALTMLAPILALVAILRRKWGLAFALNTASMALFMLTGYVGLFPYLTVGVTVTDASASLNTLTVMTVVVILFLPAVLGYQGWKFWKFRKKIDVAYFA